MDKKAMEGIRQGFVTPWKFRMMLMAKLPLGWLAGVKIEKMDEKECVTRIRYSWLNTNPFKSTFWAALGMAAEMSSGALVLMYTMGQKPSVATLVRSCSATFHAKAVGTTYFTCKDGEAIRQAVETTQKTGEGIEIVCPIEGRDEEGKLIAEFSFIWSVKAR